MTVNAILLSGLVLMHVVVTACFLSFICMLCVCLLLYAYRRHTYKDQLSNYRPISNISLISKIIERIVKSSLTDHLTSNKLLTSLPTINIISLKQPSYISTIISSVQSDHNSCHVCVSSIFLLPLTSSTTASYPPFVLVQHPWLCP